ncbi:alpha/beta fold hydrolase [Derxia lacustris]|uniref:alpha/beta fold hydrolase n=1 Tax=Derxia lacustris TaxID=764842 RepID=UPI000A17133B|nr:alpha/beta fold hydrolase [Derxia lacustris]
MTDLTLHNGDQSLALSVHGPLDGAPVLLLHGLTMSRDTWDETLAHLSDRYRCWTLDLRGHGHSGRAASYGFADHLSDVRAVLAAIGKPTVLVGHSLGGCIAGALAQEPALGIRGVLLEDPPWYLGEPAEFERSGFGPMFAGLMGMVGQLRAGNAPLDVWLGALAQGPSPAGGVGADWHDARQLLSHASALQRLDPACCAGVERLFAALDTARPLGCPALVVQADGTQGAAFLNGHELRFAASNPAARVVRYAGCGHVTHGTRGFDLRFAGELGGFLNGLDG